MWQHEIDGMTRMIEYVEKVEEGHQTRDFSELNVRQRDFVSFYRQYDQRRGKSFADTFSEFPDLVNWFNGYDTSENVNPLGQCVDGDATKWGIADYNETIATAWDQGLLK